MSSSLSTELINIIRKHLTNELRNERYRQSENKYAGHCYAASEALYHLLGGKAVGLTPMFIKHENEPHWFLKSNSGRILDPTADQFKTKVDYSLAKGKGFLTSFPSRRAKIIINRVKDER